MSAESERESAGEKEGREQEHPGAVSSLWVAIVWVKSTDLSAVSFALSLQRGAQGRSPENNKPKAQLSRASPGFTC